MSVDNAGTVNSPLPNNTSKVEPKVKWAALGTYVVGVILLALVNMLTTNDNQLLFDVLPDYLEPFVIPLVPALSALAFGFAARHQWRQAEVNGPPSGNTTIR